MDNLSNAYQQYYQKLKEDPNHSSTEARALAQQIISPAVQQVSAAKVHDAGEVVHSTESHYKAPLKFDPNAKSATAPSTSPPRVRARVSSDQPDVHPTVSASGIPREIDFPGPPKGQRETVLPVPGAE